MAVSLEGDYTSYWDSVAFWIPKAEMIYWGGGLDAQVLGTLQHPEYPQLLPTMHAATFHFAGGVHPSLLPLQHALLGIAFLLAVLALLDRFAPRWVSLPALALLATTPWFWWRLEAPLGDQPLAYLVAVAALACVIWLYEPHRAWLGLAFVLLAAATLTKLEGGFLAGLLVAVVLVAGFVIHGRAALPALVLLAAPAVILPWRLWLGHHGLPHLGGGLPPHRPARPGLPLRPRGPPHRRTRRAPHRAVPRARGGGDRVHHGRAAARRRLPAPGDHRGGRRLARALVPRPRRRSTGSAGSSSTGT